jgi:hypothetical protein
MCVFIEYMCTVSCHERTDRKTERQTESSKNSTRARKRAFKHIDAYQANVEALTRRTFDGRCAMAFDYCAPKQRAHHVATANANKHSD